MSNKEEKGSKKDYSSMTLEELESYLLELSNNRTERRFVIMTTCKTNGVVTITDNPFDGFKPCEDLECHTCNRYRNISTIG